MKKNKRTDPYSTIDEEKTFFEERNFILTKDAELRLSKLKECLLLKIPVLLEGPTGTSKTLCSEIICDSLQIPKIRFNLSSETTISDLLGKYIGNNESWAGIKLEDGPFVDAFKNGKCLILDEINLASKSVLQCIEEALDNDYLSVEIPGKPLEKVKKHDNFCLIATQNPNKGLYMRKRQDLGTKFLSRFQIIYFPKFTYDELKEIAEGLADRFNYKEKSKIKDLVAFHMKWSESPSVQNDVQCFTIRDIAATIKACSLGEKIDNAIQIIYGARYSKSKRESLEKMLKTFKSFKNLSSIKSEIPKNFPSLFPNKSIKDAIQKILFSLNNERNVIIIGEEGIGKTQLAKWISKYWNTNNSSTNEKNEEFFCICTENISCADLIGKQKASSQIDVGQEIIEWKSGFLLEAIEKGKCVVLDNLEEAPSTVTERLNCLLDKKYDKNDNFFFFL